MKRRMIFKRKKERNKIFFKTIFSSAFFSALVLISIGSSCNQGAQQVQLNSSSISVAKETSASSEQINTKKSKAVATKEKMKISSSAFNDGEQIPVEFTCDDRGDNPPLFFSDIPDGVITFALIMEDIDVPSTIRADGVWDHWLIWNIPETVTSIDKGKSPAGIFGMTTSGTTDYIAPCPPDGLHRYRFKLYALNSAISLQSGANRKDLEKAMQGYIIESAEVIGVYNRQ